VRPGDVVSIQLPNWIEFLVVHFAVTRIGAVNNPLIPIYRDREVGFMVALAQSKVIVVPQEFRGYDYPGMVDRLRGDWPALEHVLVVDGPTTAGRTSWQEFIETPWEERRNPAELAALRPDANDVTLLIFTSGTTGEPKGVMHTHNTLVAADAPLPERLGVSRNSVIHMASTFAHLTGFLYGVRLPTQVGGATAVYQDVWDAGRFVDLVEEYGISYTSAATPFLHDTLTAPGLADRDLSSLKLFCCMGAPIPRAIVREARQKLPGLTVLGGWGQSENALVTLGIAGDPEEKNVERDGYPWPGMEIRVVDFDGTLCKPGEEGRLQVRGPFLFVGYAERLELTRNSFDGDWFETGDLAAIDEEGYLDITGRTKDVIIRGGENVPVAYVENVLYEHPLIAGVAVVGVPDPRLQERACAVVTLADGTLTLAEMQAFLKEKGVARQYWPESLEVVDELPRTASGKIQKFQLRARLQAQR
jgi:cyclohexanecarboxylate-CoA ligase